MCSPKTCRQCGMTTWSGCGQHVAQVKAMVPADQWCHGHAGEASPADGGGFLSRLWGR